MKKYLSYRHSHFALNFIFVCACLFCYSATYGQVNNDQILNYRVDKNTFLFDGDLDFSTQDFITNHSSLLNIGTGDSLVYGGFEADSFYSVRIKFYQYHYGIPVDKIWGLFIEKDNMVYTHVGNLIKGITSSPTPSISESTAFSAALEGTGADTFMWEVPEMEEELKDRMNDSTATYYPDAGQLVYTWQTNSKDSSDYVLAYKYSIDCYAPQLTSYEVFVNAHTGDWIKNNSLVRKCGQVATADVMYYGTQSFLTHYRGAPHWNYVLEECNHPIGNIETRWRFKQGAFGGFKITNNSTNWGLSDQRGTTPHWLVGLSRDFFYNQYGWRGIDNNGGKVTVLAEAGTGRTGFGHSDKFGEVVYVGDRDGYYQSIYDAIGHEYTHGVDKFANDLLYERESGALDESFADIFGNEIQRHYQGGSTDWLIGEETTTLRSFARPEDFGQPSTYYGTNWQIVDQSNCPTPNESNDNCGVHTNSGVQNHWFYLLSQNIGRDKARDIAYKALTKYLFPTAEYYNSRIATLVAANEIGGGNCSREVYECRKAWSDVNVGDAGPSPYCVSIKANPSMFLMCDNRVGISVNYELEAVSVYPPDAVSWNLTGGAVDYSTSGNKLYITKFYTDQEVNIECTASWTQMPFGNTIQSTKTRKVKFIDCDGGELFGGQINPNATFGLPLTPRFVSTENSKAVRYNVYPNPASEFVEVAGNEDVEAELFLINLQGQVLESMKFINRAILNTRDLPNGVYFIKITSKNDSQVEKVILAH